MKKIMFNDRYGLTQAVLDGKKTMTRRIIKGDFEDIKAYHANGGWHFIADTKDGDSVEVKPAYEIGEKVAIAQKYWDLRNCDAFYELLQKADPTFPLECIRGERGCDNKMYVRADWMPHRIRITDIQLQRMNKITDEDCLKEGVEKWIDCYIVSGIMENKGKNNVCFDTPREAFAALIDRISGKGTWQRNPWVYVYTFELLR